MSVQHALWQPHMFHSRCGQTNKHNEFLHPRSLQTTSDRGSGVRSVACHSNKCASARVPLKLHARQPGTHRRCVMTHSTAAAADAALTAALQQSSGLWRLWAALICVAALGFQSERYRLGRELSGYKVIYSRSMAGHAVAQLFRSNEIFASQMLCHVLWHMLPADIRICADL